MIEIERKFLVKLDLFELQPTNSEFVVQGYLSRSKGREVRIRVLENKGFITIKGEPTDEGVARYEFESETSVSDAWDLLALRKGDLVQKIRTRVPVGEYVYEVDKYLAGNDGLVIAEIELSDINEEFEKPLWLGEEVTNDNRYSNSQLSKNPFKSW